jgi:hypothetical protein
VHLEGFAGGIVALQKLVLDVGLAGRRDQRRRPVLGRCCADAGVIAAIGATSKVDRANQRFLPTFISGTLLSETRGLPTATVRVNTTTLRLFTERQPDCTN